MARTKQFAHVPRKAGSSQPAGSDATGATGGGARSASPSVPRGRRTPRARASASPSAPPQRHLAAPSLPDADGGEASAFSASLSGAKRGRGDDGQEEDDAVEGPAPKRRKRFRAPSPPAHDRPALPVTVEDACAFVAAAGVFEPVLTALQAALRDEEVDGEALLATSEEELRTVLGVRCAVSRRKLALALRDATSPAVFSPPPPTPHEVAAWLRDEIGSTLGGEAFAKALRAGLDGRVLLALSDEELADVLLGPSADDAHARLMAHIMAPLRRAAAGAAAQPHGYLPSPLPARDSGSPAHHVVVLGDTGAGKSSLFNALVGERRLLPTSGMRACTAAIVELSFNRGPDMRVMLGADELSSGDGASGSGAAASAPLSAALYAPNQLYSPYVAVVEFLSAAEWRAEVEAACAALGGGDADAPLAEPEPDTPAHEAWCKVRAAFGTMPPSAAALRADASLAPLLGTAQRLKARSAEEMYDALCPYADSVAAEAAGGRQLWPLVRRVRVAGPWAPLAAGAVLVDAPGVADSDAGRGGVVRACLRRADAVWLVANARRAVNDKTVKDALLRPFRRRLVAGAGRLGSIALIATQTDTLVRSEIADNLRLAPDASLAECAAARNEYTAARIEADFWAGVQDEDAPEDDDDALPAASPRGPREAVVRGPFTPPAALPSHCKWSNAALRRAVTPASWAGWEPQPGMRGVVVHEFEEPRLDHPSPAFCVLQFGSRFALFAASALAPAPAGAAAHPPQPPLPARYAFQFPVFCVSAYEFAKMSGLRPDDGAATTFPNVEATGVPALKRFLAESVAATAAAAAAASAERDADAGAGASARAATGDVPLLDVLLAEEAQLSAALGVYQAEFAALDGPYEARSAAQSTATELAAVRANIAKEERRANPAAASAADAAGAPGVRAGALLLDCIAEAREAAAAAEAAAEEAKGEEEEAAKQPWTCVTVINAPAARPRSPGIPRDHPAYSRYGAEFTRLLDRLNAQLANGFPGHGALAFDVPQQHMERFLDVVGHKGSITQHVLGMAVSVIPLSSKKVYLRRCAPEGPRSCGFVNKGAAGQAAPEQCGRCGVARPPPCRVPDPRLLLVRHQGLGPFWTCLRPRQGDTGAGLRWRGTPRCGYFNTIFNTICGLCDRSRLPLFSLPPSTGDVAIAAMAEAELRQVDAQELMCVIERRDDREALRNTALRYRESGGPYSAADVAFLAAVVHGTNEVLAGRPRPPLPTPPDAQPSQRLLPHHYGGLSQPAAKAPEAAAPVAGPPRFIAGPYSGAKSGYLHRSGPMGRGYYYDDEVTDSDFFTKPPSQPKAAKKYVVDDSGAIDLTLSDDD